jgi:hypothetical protein
VLDGVFAAACSGEFAGLVREEVLDPILIAAITLT